MATAITATGASSTDEEYVKSLKENGRYVNSFNRDFETPGLKAIYHFIFTEKDETNLPENPRELDTTLPVIKNKTNEIVKRSPGIRFIWIGHASCLVQIDDFLFLTDPIFSERCGALPFSGPKRFRPPALTVDELPDELDAVVISHDHYDHLDYPSVQNLNQRYGRRLTWYCGLGLREWFLDAGVINVFELDWWGEVKHPNKQHVTIAFCPAQHWSRRSAVSVNKTLWGGYVVRNENYKFYFAGDTGYTKNIPIFKQIGKKYGPIDLSALPIGAYRPRYILEHQHVSPEESAQIHIDTQSKKSIGVHWGTWALAKEFYLAPPKDLQTALQRRQMDPDSFITLKHGEIFDLP